MTAQKIFVLDASVLIHDPSALFRFKAHDLYLPQAVLGSLDAQKTGISEAARSARQASQILEDLTLNADLSAIEAGLILPGIGDTTGGRLFLQTLLPRHVAPPDQATDQATDQVLAYVTALTATHPEIQVILVSKDINLRIRARLTGITAEDYLSDQVLDDVDLLYTGMVSLTESPPAALPQSTGKRHWRLNGDGIRAWLPGLCVHWRDEHDTMAMVRTIDDGAASLDELNDYRHPDNSIWGVNARNLEQNCALNMLLDPALDLVTLLGPAGTGKTLLALAAGLNQIMEMKRYIEIVITRLTVAVGEDISFLPGTEEEKMVPWMGALMDNLEVLAEPATGGQWGRAATADLLHSKIKVRSINFMRGRTFQDRYLIIDEAQNLTAKQMQLLITRAGPGSKIVCLGNLGQIDSPNLTETTSGLTHVVDRFKHWEHSGHIILHRGERSRLADYASECL